METNFDCIVIGAGPAGLSAALNLRQRGKTVLVVHSGETLLAKAEQVDNYLGMPGLSGKQMMERFTQHARDAGAVLRKGRAGNVMPFGGRFMVNLDGDILETGAVVLACGVSKAKPVPGEAELLGRGVSYCATCDAHFYKGKAVAVLGYNAESCREADFLAETCARVLYFPVVPHEVNVGPNVTVVRERVLSIPGTMRAEGVQTDLNLIMGAQGEIFETSDMYPAFIKKAQEEGNTKAVQVFTRAKLAESVHAERYLAAYNDIDAPDDDKFYLCPICGYIHKGENFTACPICLAPKSSFTAY